MQHGEAVPDEVRKGRLDGLFFLLINIFVKEPVMIGWLIVTCRYFYDVFSFLVTVISDVCIWHMLFLDSLLTKKNPKCKNSCSKTPCHI